jgi:hypothetical protein
MNTSQIADKIVISLYKKYDKTGEALTDGPELAAMFPGEPRQKVYDAIRMLDQETGEGVLVVSYGDLEPGSIILDAAATRKYDEDTWLKKGYAFAKMIRDLI